MLSVTGVVSDCRRGADERDALVFGRAPLLAAMAADWFGAACGLDVSCLRTATLCADASVCAVCCVTAVGFAAFVVAAAGLKRPTDRRGVERTIDGVVGVGVFSVRRAGRAEVSNGVARGSTRRIGEGVALACRVAMAVDCGCT